MFDLVLQRTYLNSLTLPVHHLLHSLQQIFLTFTTSSARVASSNALSISVFISGNCASNLNTRSFTFSILGKFVSKSIPRSLKILKISPFAVLQSFY